MQLLEREEALSALVTALGEARTGTGAVAFVSGEAGIGKSSVVRAFAADLTEEIRVLSGGCDDLAVPRPLGPLHEIATALPALSARLDAHPAGAPGLVLEELRRRGPSVLVIEDAHWADEATLDVIAYLARRIEALPALVVVTFRDDEIGVAHPLRRALAASAPARTLRLRLGPLSEHAVAELAGPGIDARTLHGLTGGNPFFVTESIAAGAGLSASVRDAVLGRLERLGEAGRSAAEIVSVVPGQAELWLVEACAGSSAPGLAECEAGGLLVLDTGSARFRHELARRAVEEALPGARRRELNRAVLAALTARKAPAARLAHHARWADDIEALVRHGLAAGRQASAAGSHREACGLLLPLLDHGAFLGVAERADGLDLLSTEAYLDARPEPALAARDAAIALRRELGDPLATGDSVRWLSRLRWWSGDRPGAEAAADEAIAILEGRPPGRELAMALSNRSQLAMLAQEDEQATIWAERAIALAERLDDVETLVHATTNLGSVLTRHEPERGRALLEDAADRATQAGLDEHVCRALVNAAWYSRGSGELGYARATTDRALAYAEAREQSSFTEYLTALSALIDLSTGEWDRAVAAAGSLPQDRNQMTRVPALEVLGLVALRRGEPEAAEHLATAWRLAEASQELQRIRPIACARAEAAWLAGDEPGMDDATRDAYVLALRQGDAWDVGELAVWRHRAGCLKEAPESCAVPFALEIAGDPSAAAGRWGELGMPYERALALAGTGDQASLLEAVEILDRLGATATGARVRRRLKEMGVERIPRGPRATTRRNPAGLTSRQVEILGLVAGGLTNTQIAARLVLSAKTVEHHVAAILSKLDVGTRGEAVDAARDLGVELGEKMGGARP